MAQLKEKHLTKNKKYVIIYKDGKEFSSMVAGGAHLLTEPAGERRAVPVKMRKTPQRPPKPSRQ